MENKIKLVMNDDKSIEVYVNDTSKHKIIEERREISAKEIYDIFNYKTGDKYEITSENAKELDKPVLMYFLDLFNSIKTRIEEIKNDDSEGETDDKETV